MGPKKIFIFEKMKNQFFSKTTQFFFLQVLGLETTQQGNPTRWRCFFQSSCGDDRRVWCEAFFSKPSTLAQSFAPRQ